MNNLAKFIIFALLIVAIAFGYKAYKSGAFENVKAEKQTIGK
jgi:predicted negative regulator of RcsB-dependent stress response